MGLAKMIKVEEQVPKEASDISYPTKHKKVLNVVVCNLRESQERNCHVSLYVRKTSSISQENPKL